MKLLLDGGNTRVKWVCWEGDAPGASGVLIHGGKDWSDLPRHLAPSLAVFTPDTIWVVEVLGSGFRQACHRLCESLGWPAPRFLSPDPERLGIRSDYREPARLGLDRYAAMAGARALGHETAIIVDCGTAVTLDLMVPAGCHRGGLILPGLGLMRRSLGLAQGVAGMTEGRDDRTVAVCTEDAVSSGTLQGLAGAIVHLSRRLLEGLDAQSPSPARLLTGGDAQRIHPLLDEGWQIEPFLVFRGLAVVADKY